MSDSRAGSIGPPDPPENFPPYKHEFVQKALDIDGVVTEIEENRFGQKYHAWLEADDWVWMATIDDDGRGDNYPKVGFRKCLPGHDIRVLHSWSSVATNRCLGPKSLEAWGILFEVFSAARDLRYTHQNLSVGDGNE